jgi:hypothetical protein
MRSLFVSTDIKLILHKALIRTIIVYACPTSEYVAYAHLLKLQLLQNRILRATGNLSGRTPVPELHVAFKIPYVYDYITNYEGNRQKSSKIIQIQMSMQLDTANSCIGSTQEA